VVGDEIIYRPARVLRPFLGPADALSIEPSGSAPTSERASWWRFLKIVGQKYSYFWPVTGVWFYLATADVLSDPLGDPGCNPAIEPSGSVPTY